MKLKLFLQILILSSFSYILNASLPVANPTAASVVQSVGTVLTLTGSGSGSLTFSITTQPSHGTLSGLNANTGTVTYTSTNSFLGLDTFTFQVTNSSGISSPAKVSLMILPYSVRAYLTDLNGSGNNNVTIINNGAVSGNVSGQNPAYLFPSALVATPNNAKAYVCYNGSGNISVINTATNATLQDVFDPAVNLNNPIAIAISPDGSIGYICNNISNTGDNISIFDPLTDTVFRSNVSDPHAYIQNPFCIGFTPDGLRAYVASANISNVAISMINVVNNTVEAQVAGIILTDIINNFVISPDGNFCYVLLENGGPVGLGSILIIDINPLSMSYNQVVGAVDDVSHSLHQPTQMAITPNGLKGYVLNFNNTVSIVDLDPTHTASYQKVVGLIGLNGHSAFNLPVSVAFTSDGSQAYVVNTIGNFVSVINVASDNVSSTISISAHTNPQWLFFIENNPTANPTAASVVQHVPTIITVTGTDPESESLTFSITTQPIHGTLTYLDRQTSTSVRYTYTSTGTYIGADSFAYEVTNTSGLVSSPAKISLTILPQSAKAYVSDLQNSGSSNVDIITGVGISPNSSGSVVGQSYAYAYDLVVTPNQSKAYVCYPLLSKVSVINIATNELLSFDLSDPLSTLNQPFSLAISPDGSMAYVSNFGGDTISIVDIATDVITGTVVDLYAYISGPVVVVFTPDGLKAYVMCPSNSSVCMIDVATNSVIAQINNPSFTGLIDIAISPDGNFVYVVDEYGGAFSTGAIFIIDINQMSPTYNTVVGTINDASYHFNRPVFMAISTDGTKSYVLNESNNKVSIVNLTSNTVTGFVTDLSPVTFNGVVSVSFTANGLQAYVVNERGLTISIIDVPSNTVISKITGYVFPGPLAFLGNGVPFYSISNQSVPYVTPIASVLDSSTGIVYEVGNAQDGSGDLVLMANSVAIGNFGPVRSFTKSGQATGGAVSYSTTSLLDIGGASFTQLDMALQTVNGVSKIIVSGSNNFFDKGFVARFNTIPVANSLDGVLDDTFGDFQSGTAGLRKGYAVFNGVGAAAGLSTFSSCAVDANQNIVVAGSVGGGALQGKILIARYKAAHGDLDTTFGQQPQTGYGYSTILGLSGTGYLAIIDDIEFDPLKNIYLVGQYQAPLIPAPGLSQQGVAGTSPFISKFVNSGIPDQTFCTQYGTLMIPVQYVNGQGEFTKCLYDINSISNLSSQTMYASGVIKNLKTSPITDYATLIRFSIANLNLSASQAFVSGNAGAPLANLQGNICPSLVVPPVTSVKQISGAQGGAVITFNSIKTSQDVQNILSLSGVVYNLKNSLQGAGATATLAQSIADNFKATMVEVIDNFVTNYSGNLLQNILFLSQSIAINECLLTENVSKFIYLQLIYNAEKTVQINIKTAASYCTSVLNSPYN